MGILPGFCSKIIDVYDHEYYIIIDAKYSSIDNIKKRYFPELVLKYTAQIASKDKHFADIIGLGAIYPDTDDRIFYYRRNNVKSTREPLPQYFSLSIMGEDDGNNSLKERVRSLSEKRTCRSKWCQQ